MNILKKTLCVLMVTLLVLTAAPLSSFAEVDFSAFFVKAAESDEKRIQCGDNVYFTCDEKTGVAVISGEGPMWDRGYLGEPYFSFQGAEKIIIEEGVTRIGDYAFRYENNLKELVIPDSVTAIGQEAFYSTGIYNDESNFEDGLLYVDDCLVYADEYDLKSDCVIREGTRLIAEYLFYENETVKSVTLPESLGYIGESAFACMKEPESITIPGNIKSVAGSAFDGCEKLSEVIISEGFENIAEYMFTGCKALKTVTLPDTLLTVGDSAFQYCESLTEITFSDSIKRIGNSAFSDCDSLVDITIPDVNISIGRGAFSYTGYSENYDNHYERGVYIGKHLVEFDCRPGGEYEIRSGTLTIADGAFGLAFWDIEKITVPASVIRIGTKAFAGRSVKKISVNSNNNYYTSENGILFNKDKTELVQFPDHHEATSYTVPDTVKLIGEAAFYGCENLSAITISEGVTEIGAEAFYWCTGINSIFIPDSVVKVGKDAFHGCNKMKSVSMGFGLSEISEGMFGWCFELETVMLAPTIEAIGNMAFEECEALKSIMIPSSVKTIGEYAFRNCESLETVYLYDGLEEMGYGAFYNCTSLQKITLPGTLNYIGEYVFGECENLTKIIIPSSVKAIGKNAFRSCTKLKDLYFMDGLTEIGESAFHYCEGLEEVLFPGTLATIGKNAFYSCGSLKRVAMPLSVTEIGESAFKYCDSVERVDYAGSSDEWYEIYIGSYNDKIKRPTHYNSSVSVVIPPEAPDLPELPDVSEIPESASTTYKGVTATLDNSDFEKDSAVFNQSLGAFCSLFTVIGYEKTSTNTILRQLMNCGFTSELKDIRTNEGETSVNHFLAHKLIEVDGEVNMLFFAGFIGSHKAQWYTNFDPGTGFTHKNFNIAKEYMYDKLTDYIAEKNIYDLESDKIKILITGHSRGAAVANLVAKELIADEDYALKENIYTYAFATPNSTRLDEARKAEFKRIFNIVNPEDFVTKMLPSAWGYERYGTTYVLPSKTNTKNSTYKKQLSYMRDYFEKLTGKKYEPYDDAEKPVYKIVDMVTSYINNTDEFYRKGFSTDLSNGRSSVQKFFTDAICPIAAEDEDKKDDAALYCAKVFSFGEKPLSSIADFFITNQVENEFFAHSHLAETYCAYMYTLSEKVLTDSENKAGYKGTVNCPVDVEIYDNETDNLVGRIVNNTVDEAVAQQDDSVVMYVEGDSKSFILPGDGDYEIKLIGNGEGTMDFSLALLDSDVGEVKRANYFDVEITEGLTMTSEIKAEETVIEETVLEKEDGETIVPDEITDAENTVSYNIDTVCEGQGNVTSSHTVKSGDYVSLSAAAAEDWQFTGWYENGNLISEESNLAFVARADRKLTASFTHLSHNYEKTEIKAPDCTDKGEVTFTCLCGDSYTEETAPLGHTEVTDAAVAPTCTAEGKTEGKHCSVCNEVLVAQTAVPATGHKLTTLNAVEATCTKTGLTVGKKCTVCNTVTVAQKAVAKKAHTNKTTVTKATLSKDGKTEIKCTVCGAVSATTVINKVKTVKLSKTTFTYNGKTQTPSVTVKDSKGNTLKKDVDYTVTYPKKRKSIGKYTVTVTLKGKYSGTKKLTFEIVPAKATLSKLTAGSKQLTASWKTVSGVTGYEVQYSTSKKFTKKTTKTVTIKKAKTKKTTIKKLKKGKKYFVKVRAYKTVSGKKLYGAWSKSKSIKVR